jgi:uncharacterized protein with FMN-binding domain
MTRQRIGNDLLALGSCVVLTVYAAGYIRTQRSASLLDTGRVITPPIAARTNDTPPSQWKDGVYSGWGTSRHGDIQASVEIRDGRVTSAQIAQCLTRYSCAWIADLPPQVVARQDARVDVVSGATQSSDAFSAAVADALRKAK